MVADEEIGLTVHSFPFNLQEMLDGGGEINPDFEDNLTVGDLSIGSDWQTGLPLIRLGTKDMPLFLFQSLNITREVEELIEEEGLKDITL